MSDKERNTREPANLDPEAVGKALKEEGLLGASKAPAGGSIEVQKSKRKFSMPKVSGKNSSAIMVALTVVISLVLTIAVVTFMCPTKSQMTDVNSRCSILNTEMQSNSSRLATVSNSLDTTITSLNTTVTAVKGLQTSVSGIQTSLTSVQATVSVLQASSYSSGTQFTVGGNSSGTLSGNSSIGYTGNLSSILNLLYNESTSQVTGSIVPVEPVLISPLAVANHSACTLVWSYTGTLNSTWFQVYLSSATDSWTFNTSSTSYILPSSILTINTPYAWWISATGTDGIDNTSSVGQFTTY